MSEKLIRYRGYTCRDNYDKFLIAQNFNYKRKLSSNSLPNFLTPLERFEINFLIHVYPRLLKQTRDEGGFGKHKRIDEVSF